jgi:hypothetical protein
MSSIGFWRWYINITITILDIIHRPVFYLKQYVSGDWILYPSSGGTYSAEPCNRAILSSETGFAWRQRQNVVSENFQFTYKTWFRIQNYDSNINILPSQTYRSYTILIARRKIIRWWTICQSINCPHFMNQTVNYHFHNITSLKSILNQFHPFNYFRRYSLRYFLILSNNLFRVYKIISFLQFSLLKSGVFLRCFICATHSAHLNFLYLITRVTFGEEYKLWSWTFRKDKNIMTSKMKKKTGCIFLKNSPLLGTSWLNLKTHG